MNYDGKRKRILSKAGVAFFKYKDFKKAVVYFDDSLHDVGIGTRVPELEDKEEDADGDIMDIDPSNGDGGQGQKRIGG